jgi:hypothetical protein
MRLTSQGFPGWRKDDGIKQLIKLRCKGKEQGLGVRDRVLEAAFSHAT